MDVCSCEGCMICCHTAQLINVRTLDNLLKFCSEFLFLSVHPLTETRWTHLPRQSDPLCHCHWRQAVQGLQNPLWVVCRLIQSKPVNGTESQDFPPNMLKWGEFEIWRPLRAPDWTPLAVVYMDGCQWTGVCNFMILYQGGRTCMDLTCRASRRWQLRNPWLTWWTPSSWSAAPVSSRWVAIRCFDNVPL